MEPTPAFSTSSAAPCGSLPFLRHDDPNRLFSKTNRRNLGAGCFAFVYSAECVEARSPDHGFLGLAAGDVYAIKVLRKDPPVSCCNSSNAVGGRPANPNANALLLPAPMAVPTPRSRSPVVDPVGTDKGNTPVGREEVTAVTQKWHNVVHEIAILKKLNSPYCVRLHDSFQDERNVYLVLEYVPFAPLLRVIQNRVGWSERKVALITEQLIRALIFLHGRNVVHRDLKPDNILVDETTMQVKLIDFGFAKFFGRRRRNGPRPHHAQLNESATDSASETLASTPVGATKFLAPEVLVASLVNPRVTTRTDIQKLDIFAVGVIVYLMLGAEYPFRATSRKGLEQAIRKGVSFPSPRFDEVSEEARDFCQWLLHHDREYRPFARDCLAHPWLMGQASDQPYSSCATATEDEDLPLTDDGLFEELRRADSVLDKSHISVAAQEKDGLQNAVEQRKCSKTLVLKLPERVKNAVSANVPRNSVE